MNLLVLSLFLGILVHETSAKDEDSKTLSCPAHQPCTIAFASRNPITLKCEGQPKNAAVYWQYVDILQPHAPAVTFIERSDSVPEDEDLISEERLALDIMSRSMVISGKLKLLSPRVQDTGIYTCRDEEKYLAYYEIDFQDAENIYILHARLGNRVQPNTTIDLGKLGTAELFTIWSDWQPCDRCEILGERKRLGFCYITITRNSTDIVGPKPCGLLPSNLRKIQLNRTPELRIETCRVACTETVPTNNEDLIMVLENYRTYLHADALFKCPSASIYKPVSWEHGNTSFTHLQQMMNKAPYVMDKATGGMTLFIPTLNESDDGLYKCYVNHQLMGQFHVIFLNTEDRAERRHYSRVEYVVMGLLLFLLALFFLALFQSCTESTERRFSTFLE